MRLVTILAVLALAGCNQSSDDGSESESMSEDGGRMWVTSQYLDRHTCASESCGIVGRLFFREAADVLEIDGDWARITDAYDASCVNGISEYVDSGDANCTDENGITDGKFAEWVLVENLAVDRPADPAETAAEDERMVAQSDDFAQYRDAFTTAARTLINDGRCTAAEFEEMGGWVKSSNDRDRPVYFTYCGGMTTANRIYLNAETGEIYR